MLSELHIENVAVVKNVTLSAEKGFSVLTGETGAGKSIIIDAINLLLGARSAKELIRSGESRALVSACFTELSERTLAALEAAGTSPDADGTLYIQRTVQTDGKATAKINGRTVPVSMLKEIGSALITIHGQHDSQALLSPENHMAFLDRYAKNSDLLQEYAKKYEKLASLRKTLSERTKAAERADERVDTLKYQISEIDAAKLKKNELETLNEKKQRIKSSEKMYKYARLVSDTLSDTGSADGAASLTARAAEALRKLSEILPDAEMLAARLESARYDMIEAAEQATALIEMCGEAPEEELERIESRLDTVERIFRKYGPTEEDVFRYRDKAAEELATLSDIGSELSRLKKALNEQAKETFAAAEKLTASRTRAAEELSKSITEELRYLDLEKVVFSVSVEKLISEKGLTRFTPDGCDAAEFMISANPGEPLKPLAKIASGGELSRVMLAIRSILAECDGVDTLIFDEIDTGVSGKTSQKIGIKLRSVSKGGQVLCITHSAQIAAAADAHYKISKSEKDGRTETSLTLLDREGRINELSRIMGGIEITDTVRKTAEEMINAYK